MTERYEKWLHKNFFINNFRNGMIYISGGTDSALALYLLCEYVEKHNIDNVILQPVYSWEMKKSQKRRDGYKTINRQIEWIKQKFRKITILPLYLYAVDRTWEDNSKKFDVPVYELMKHLGKIDFNEPERFVIRGVTLRPQDDNWRIVDESIHYELDWGLNDWDIHRQPDTITPSGVPFVDRNILSSYDKKGVAKIYREKNLQELFKITGSCHVPREDGSPCKVCVSCSEKFWAFGCYDGEDYN